MPNNDSFTGFPRECLDFYRALKRHNDKLWFAQHRDDYETHVMAPARAFVLAMGERMRGLAPGLHADPRVNRSIFRIQRDTRFSPDKIPFKTNLGIWLWEGDGPRMECSGFYFQIEPPNLFLGVGLYLFPKHELDEYRRSLVDKQHGREFARVVAQVEKHGLYEFGEKHYKRVPRGFAADHPHAEFLKFSGLYAGLGEKLPPQLHSAALVDYCHGHFKALLPVHRWVSGVINRAQSAQADNRSAWE
jgi:uncharacterized protein (TIGR02453 family)